MNNYDSILKEKKTYKETTNTNSGHTKYVIIYIISSIILLFICYIIYYWKVLTPSNILLSDLNHIYNKYNIVISKILPKKEDISNIEGIISSNSFSYSYKIINEDNLYFELNDTNNSLLYQESSFDKYISLSSFNDDALLVKSNNHMLSNYKNKINNLLSTKKSLKKLYMSDKVPVVEISLTLNNEDITNILGISNLSDEYEVIMTLKNNALTYQFLSGKVVVVNKTLNKRLSLQYENSLLNIITNDGDVYGVTISENNADFNLKIYKGEELHSILLGKKKENTYQYIYQIIDKIYNIEIDYSLKNNKYTYSIKSNIEINGVEEDKNIEISFIKIDEFLKKDISNYSKITYADLLEEDKNNYRNELNIFLLPLKDMFYYYVNNIK